VPLYGEVNQIRSVLEKLGEVGFGALFGDMQVLRQLLRVQLGLRAVQMPSA